MVASRGSRPSRSFSNPRNSVPMEKASTTCWTPLTVSILTSTLRWPSMRVMGSMAAVMTGIVCSSGGGYGRGVRFVERLRAGEGLLHAAVARRVDADAPVARMRLRRRDARRCRSRPRCSATW